MPDGQPHTSFAERLILWQQQCGRHNLPWQGTTDPYLIWVSEIMLQQTQVTTVVPYYQRFIGQFPNVATLAAANLESVLQHWSGLGYYARARNLHRCAQQVMRDHAGHLPNTQDQLAALPGIGRSTAAAITVFAWQHRNAILDGNVKRILCRHFYLAGNLARPAMQKILWAQAEALLPSANIATYTQALMDLGATRCTRKNPDCGHCPIAYTCQGHQLGLVAELPAPKPGKIKPLRQVSMLLITRSQKIYLIRRPPAGIWGGLWSLPEIPLNEDIAEYVVHNFGSSVMQPVPIPTLMHSFTHFHLEIHPVWIQLMTPNASDPSWIDMAEALQRAIPAPVRKLIKQLHQLM